MVFFPVKGQPTIRSGMWLSINICPKVTSPQISQTKKQKKKSAQQKWTGGLICCVQLKTVCAICLSIQTALCNANLALQKKDQPVIRQIVTGGWVVGKKNETAVDCQYSTKNDQQLNKRLELV